MEWFAFKAADEILGMDAGYIYRIIGDIRITPVPLAPECYLGLIYYRGEMFNVVDVVDLMGYGKADLDTDNRIILVKWSDKKLAFASDKIIGLLWIEDDKVENESYTDDEYTVRRITPELIWNKLMELSYGSN